MKPIRLATVALVMLAALAALAALPGPAGAQARPGVGYSAQARGFLYSFYRLDSVSAPFQRYAIDFSADPGAVGNPPNPYGLNIGDPAVKTAYEQRYGPDTLGPRFKAFTGPNNEVRYMVHDALVWWFANRAGDLGADATGRNGLPTEVEITDVQATGDRAIWVTYMQNALDGYSQSRPLQINDPAKPKGNFTVMDTFWNLPVYYHNNFRGYFPFSPQVPIP